MPKKTKAVEPVADEQSEPKKTKAVEFDVVDSSGNVKRIYKVADHGDEAEDLANQFAKKFGFTVK